MVSDWERSLRQEELHGSCNLVAEGGRAGICNSANNNSKYTEEIRGNMILGDIIKKSSSDREDYIWIPGSKNAVSTVAAMYIITAMNR